MRLIALYAMLAAASTLSLCERRNPELCKEDDAAASCAPGLVCRAGRCEEPECSDNAGCGDEARPICKKSLCAPCQLDDECAGRDPGEPYCRAGRCVACTIGAECPDPLRPICDQKRFQCRPCQAHSECAGGVCAKDDLLASPPGPMAIQAGTCVPSSRVLFVDQACRAPALCSPKEALDMVSPAQPYIYLRSGSGPMFTNLTVPGRANGSALRTIHIIGGMADSSPTRTDTPPATLGGPAFPALSIDPGYRVVVEGVAIQGGSVGVQCTGTGKAADSELRLERVHIGGADTAVSVNECRLQVRQSWIGAGAGLVFGGALGNRQAMKIVNSEFTLENSVLFRNRLPGSFGGIELFYDPMWKGGRSSIVNSTIAYHDVPAGSGAVSLDCNGSVADRLVIWNSYFYNESLKWQDQPTRHIADACQVQLGAVATNDERLSAAASPGVLVKSDAEAGFRSGKDGDLRLLPEAPEAITVGGAARLQRGALDLQAPAVDLDGAPRGARKAGRVSIGAFEVPGP